MMEKRSTEAAYAGSDRGLQAPTTTTDSDNDMPWDGGAENTKSDLPLANGSDDLERLFESDDDLKLWLEHTRFFDIEYRYKVLDGLRKLKALEEQRSEILLTIQNTVGSTVTPSVSYKRHDSITSTAHASLSSLDIAAPQATTAYATSQIYCSGFPIREKPNKTGTSIVNEALPSDDDGLGGRPTTKRTGTFVFPQIHQHDRPIATTSSFAPAKPERTDLLRDQAHNDRCCCERNHRVSTGVPRQRSKMNGKSETRYFLVKSFNTKNVEMSQRDAIWVTKAKNGPVFTEAFSQSKAVILFFSINKSKAFQGFARMVTAPRPDITKAEWMSNIDWETSHPFHIEWLNTRRTEFWKIGDLRNSLNDGAPVFVGRDGQEYPADCGRRIMDAMDRGVEKRDDGPPWAVSHAWNKVDLARSDSRQSLRSHWRRTGASPAGHTGSGREGTESQHDMTLIEY